MICLLGTKNNNKLITAGWKQFRWRNPLRLTRIKESTRQFGKDFNWFMEINEFFWDLKICEDLIG